MAKTVAEKLLIKPNSTLWTSHVDRLQPVEPLPEGVELIERPGEAPTALVWASDEASLRELLSAHGSGLVQAATLWVAYPKGNRADINRDTLWPILAEYGLRPIGQVAVDDAWSALRFRPLREGEPQFSGGR